MKCLRSNLQCIGPISIFLVTLWTGNAFSALPECIALLEVRASQSQNSKVDEQAVVETANRLVELGAVPLTAARLAIDYPEIATRILNQASGNELEWITLYRGFNGSINDHDPHFYNLNPLAGGNLYAPPAKLFPQGIFTSSAFAEGMSYAQLGVYSTNTSSTSTVVELRIPRFLVRKHFIANIYFYIPRSNTPEIDLWFTRYMHVDGLEQALAQGTFGQETVWQQFDNYYMSTFRREALPNPLARFGLNIFRILNQVKARVSF